MKNVLATFQNIPVSSAAIVSLFPNIKAKSAKISQLEKSNEIIRLKRNLFVTNPEESGLALSTGLIANHLLAPSYVSQQTALRHYGLIPEAVYTTQSMTLKAAKTFNTAIGVFSYTHISKETYAVGLRQEKDGNAYYIIASPEKALCDLIATMQGVNLRYKKEALAFLEEDIRLDMERFCHFNTQIFEEYMKFGKKANSIATIIKLLDK